MRLMAVQGHPEASPGPHDALHLFREFRDLVASGAMAGSERSSEQGAADE
jgi:carbamoylphosphate synthase small subunit